MNENKKLVLVDSIMPMQTWLITDKAQISRETLISQTWEKLLEYHKMLSKIMYGIL